MANEKSEYVNIRVRRPARSRLKVMAAQAQDGTTIADIVDKLSLRK